MNTHHTHHSTSLNEGLTLNALQSLRALNPEIRLQSAKSLKKHYQAQPAVMTALVELSFSNHQKIAQEALEELAQIDDPQAFWFLKDLMKWGATEEIRQKARVAASLWQESKYTDFSESKRTDISDPNEILFLPPIIVDEQATPPGVEGVQGLSSQGATPRVPPIRSPLFTIGEASLRLLSQFAKLRSPRLALVNLRNQCTLPPRNPLPITGRIFKVLAPSAPPPRSGRFGLLLISTWPIQSLLLTMTTLAEWLILIGKPTLGLSLNILTLFILLNKQRQPALPEVSRLNTVLLLIPLMRILSLGLPLSTLSQPYTLLAVAIPIFIAIFFVIRSSPKAWTRQELGLTLNYRPTPAPFLAPSGAKKGADSPYIWLLLQLLMPITGAAFGWLLYQILTPEPLATELTWQALWLPALILLVSTSALEELLFRGLLQSAAMPVMSPKLAIIFVAALSTILHIGYASLPILLITFTLNLAFGYIVARTHSIIGVTLTHGLINISLFLLYPLW